MAGMIKTDEEVERVKESGRRLSGVLERVIASVRPGISTAEIDALAEKLIREEGGIPIFKGYGGGGRPFPASLCTSLNAEVVHGIPRPDVKVQAGDLLKLDIGMRFEGMVTDMARTIAIGNISEEGKRLMAVTEESLRRGISVLKAGARISDYARAVQGYVEGEGFSVVRDLVGHGVGYELHESPNVPNFVPKRMQDVVLRKNMVLALEPMINAGSFAVALAPDQWTFVTEDGKLSAHFEDTVVITEKGAIVVTRPS